MEQYLQQHLKDWALEDRPREKLLAKGISSLTDAELVAILIGSGNLDESAVELSRRILLFVKYNLHELGKLNVDNLKSFKGIGDAKAVAIIAAMELGRRRDQSTALELNTISNSKDVASYLRPLIGDLLHEEFWALFLSRNNKVLYTKCFGQGGITGTVIDVRVVLKMAIEKNAVSLIFAHNHPSGNLEPSEADRKITKQIKEAGAIMDIPLLDHLIITQSGYFSFADEGFL